MPKDAAEGILERIEDYNREFYSGYLGPVNIQNRSQLFVNIRTMKIENGQAFAFAGGGITEDSDPEKEWNETEIKLQTILKSFS
jgi:isochorismate synthase